MIFFKAQRLQELARQLLALERRLEAGGGDAKHVREGLDEVAERAGVDLGIVRLATPDTVLEVLSPGGAGDPGKRWAVAEILFLDGLRAFAVGDGEASRSALAKAERLFRSLDPQLTLPPGAAGPGERLERIGELLRPPD